jgi:DNA-binding IclR family transcriptional regulator
VTAKPGKKSDRSPDTTAAGPNYATSATSAPRKPDKETSGGSQTLERGLRLLALLAERPSGLTVSAISKEMETHRAGIYRLLRPLEAAQLVERRSNGAYTLGLGLVSLAASVRSRLQEVAAHELQLLADELSCTCALTIRHGAEAVVALVQEPVMSRMHIAYRRGLRHPLTQAASGLAILAADSPRPDERDEITTARRVGYAITRNELFAGATGVGVPITGTDGTAIASISILWLGEELDETRAADALRECAAKIKSTLTQTTGNSLAQPITLH